MSKPPHPSRTKNTVPVALVLEPSPVSNQLLTSYCSSVVAALQVLHPHTQLLITAVTPTSHAIPLNPFLPPAAFLAALPSFIRRPARPTSTLWRSTTGLLRAIKLARKRLLEGSLAGAGGEGRGQLPKYVVVISATDVENIGGNEIWLEDYDQGETWQSVAKNFTKGQHCTTLFSLISLGHTPNLEAFWRESCGRFPPNLIYNSTGPAPSSGFTFPLIAPTHACFLIGFYNNNARLGPVPARSETAGTTPGTSGTKRPAPPDATTNKKSKPNPPSLPPATSGSPLLGSLGLSTAQKPTPPATKRTPSQPPASVLRTSPQLQQKPSPSLSSAPANLTNENLQQYIHDMQLNAQRNGQPPPSASDLQAAALAAYANDQQQRAAAAAAAAGAPGNANGPVGQPPSSQQARATPTPRTASAPLPASLNQMSTAQINALPQLPQDLRAQIQGMLDSIKQKLAAGQLSQQEAQSQVGRLQEFANESRLRIARNQQAGSQGSNQPTANHGQGLGLNIPLAPGLQQQPQPQPQPQPQQHGRQLSQPQPPAPPQRQDSNDGKRSSPAIWRGPISVAFNNSSGKAANEFTLYCQAVPLQSSAMRDLADIKLPPSFRIAWLVQIKMSALQALAQQHTLPAMTMEPIPSEGIPKELKDKQLQQSGGKSNEQLYTMFAHTLETRSNCGIVRFPGTPHGVVLVAYPKESKILGLVFAKVALPDAWLKATASPPASVPHQRTASHQPVPQPLHVPRPPSAQSHQQSGMFSSPVPFNLQLPPQPNTAPPPPAPPFANTAPSSQSFALRPQQPFNLAQPPAGHAPPPSQQQPPLQPPVPEGSVGGMDFAELQRLLGPEQFAAIMSGI
ncbi:hypothetical protein JCM11641_005588 [Rhodosporidiobolus odoratus]